MRNLARCLRGLRGLGRVALASDGPSRRRGPSQRLQARHESDLPPQVFYAFLGLLVVGLGALWLGSRGGAGDAAPAAAGAGLVIEPLAEKAAPTPRSASAARSDEPRSRPLHTVRGEVSYIPEDGTIEVDGLGATARFKDEQIAGVRPTSDTELEVTLQDGRRVAIPTSFMEVLPRRTQARINYFLLERSEEE